MEVPSRVEVLEGERRAGKRIAAVLPIHQPRALLRAFGFHPIEVWGPPGVSSSVGHRHLQEYTCAVVRNAAGFLSGSANELIDCILVPHTCDSLQGLASILQGFLPTGRPVLTLYHPRGRGEAHAEFLARELRSLADRLHEISGVAPSDELLHGAIDAETEADRAFAEICAAPGSYALDDRSLYGALRTREYLPAEMFVELTRSLPKGAGGDGVPVMMSGIVPEPMAVFDHLNRFGARVVADDLACCARRVYRAGNDADPFLRLAKQMLSRPPDPSAGANVDERIDYLVNRMESSGARGLLFYNLKFCEPELFFLPLQREALEARGWHTLYVEEDLDRTLSGQALTRMEAFVEMLQ